MKIKGSIIKKICKYIVTILAAVVLAFTLAGCNDDKLPEGTIKFKEEFGMPYAIALRYNSAYDPRVIRYNKEVIEYFYSFVENVIYTQTNELSKEDKEIEFWGLIIVFGYKDGKQEYKDNEIYCSIDKTTGKSVLTYTINDTEYYYLSEEGAIDIDTVLEYYDTLNFSVVN